MFKNYLKITLRNLSKYKTYSIINISGLALGLACTFLILLWIKDETSYDKSFKDADLIYRVNWDYKWNNSQGIGPTTPPPLAAALVNNIPDVAKTTRIYSVSKMTVRYKDKFFNESRIFGADSNFFDLFNYKFITGSPGYALKEPNSIVLTEETARKYFGNEPPLGKLITIGQDKKVWRRIYHNTFKVTGVVQTNSLNSHIRFDMLTSISSHPEVANFDWSWIWMQVTTYAKLKSGVSPVTVESMIPPLVKRYAPPAFKRIGFSYEELIKNGGKWDFKLQPLNDIYLKSSEIGNRLGPLGNSMHVYIFSIIAGFILFLACINFINLATAFSSVRAKEIGIRKVLGSKKGMIVTQFLVESTVFSFMALLAAILIVELLLSPFNLLTGKTLHFNPLNSIWLIASIILVTLFVGLISGSYPGIYLSSFKPVKVLLQKVSTGVKNQRLRNLLVVFQFIITSGLITCTLLVRQQINYVKNADLGFNKEGLIIINNDNNLLGEQTEAFINDIKTNPAILNVTFSTGVPPNFGFQDYYKIEGKGDKQYDLISYMVDENFIKTMGIKLKEGRDFSKEFSTDSKGVILNEAAANYFGLTDPIGKTINYPGQGNYNIIGVIKNFNFFSLHDPVMPFALFNKTSNSYQIPDSYLIVRIAKGKASQSISFLENEWKSFMPSIPMEFSFLDENFNGQYFSEQRLGKIFSIFSMLTIFIACIGLFGLVSFVSEQRTKEIGIRKVLGASVEGVVLLLSKDFLKLIFIANLIAGPIAWYVMNKWLQNFAYRVNMNLIWFILTIILTLLIGFLSISGKTIKVALNNPVKSLKYE